ncbi:MAG: hypothetical protein LUF34_00960, partial [Lachnospiraceae bacterium]|nr:hypothetical protein [Lachnospiraceae bacterium]
KFEEVESKWLSVRVCAAGGRFSVRLWEQRERRLRYDGSVCIYYCYPIMNFVKKAGVSGVTSTLADYYWVSAETDVE